MKRRCVLPALGAVVLAQGATSDVRLPVEPPMTSLSPTDPSGQIADHGLLSNCQGAALVTRDGTVDWACLPRFDLPSVDQWT